ncbi:MAG TPA: NAD(P)(+) transhydrogenase (Re/Si-specific) subunit alpha, partial [Pirellulales bacterium]
MKIGVPKETFPGERRVALSPNLIPQLVKAGHNIVVQTGAGEAAGFPDSQYTEKGAAIGTRSDVFGAELIAQVRAAGANPEAAQADLEHYQRFQIVIAICDPLSQPKLAAEMAQRGVTLFSLELMPRITRAQSMDVLSSMATIAGYRAVLLGATALPKMFPMMTTAAGT